MVVLNVDHGGHFLGRFAKYINIRYYNGVLVSPLVFTADRLGVDHAIEHYRIRMVARRQK